MRWQSGKIVYTELTAALMSRAMPTRMVFILGVIFRPAESRTARPLSAADG